MILSNAEQHCLARLVFSSALPGHTIQACIYVAGIRNLLESSFRQAAITVKKKFGSWTGEAMFPVNEVQNVASGG